MNQLDDIAVHHLYCTVQTHGQKENECNESF